MVGRTMSIFWILWFMYADYNDSKESDFDVSSKDGEKKMKNS